MSVWNRWKHPLFCLSGWLLYGLGGGCVAVQAQAPAQPLPAAQTGNPWDQLGRMYGGNPTGKAPAPAQPLAAPPAPVPVPRCEVLPLAAPARPVQPARAVS